MERTTKRSIPAVFSLAVVECRRQLLRGLRSMRPLRLNAAGSMIFALLLGSGTLSACRGQSTESGTGRPVQQIAAAHILALFSEAGLMVIHQDRDQRYWFGGSDKGLFCYDGKELVLFTKEDGLCGTGVLGIQEDEAGNIYFDTTEGVSKYDGKTFSTLAVDPTRSKHDWKLEPGDLWFRMGWDHSGPFRYDGRSLYALEFPPTPQADTFRALYPNVSFNPYGIYSIYTDGQGSLWFGTSSLGVYRYDGNSVRWLYEKHLTEAPSGGSFGIRATIEDRDGNFWFSNTRERFTILPDDPGQQGSKEIRYSKRAGIGYSTAKGEVDFPYFMSITLDDVGDLWMAAQEEGVWHMTEEVLVHHPITKDGAVVPAFSIYTDNGGTIWVGTRDAGAYRFDGERIVQFVPGME